MQGNDGTRQKERRTPIITLNRKALRDGVPAHQDVADVVRQFEAGLPHLERLADYYAGRHDVLLRLRLEGLPNNRMAHAFPRYITQVSAAYLLGEAVRIEGPEPASAALRKLLLQASADSVDLELAIAQAVYGRAVSLCYEGAGNQPFVCALDPRASFLVYDDTVQHDPLFGVYLYGPAESRAWVVCTQKHLITYPSGSPKAQPAVLPHSFQALPMAEYLNGSDGHGDFEDVMSLINAYDLLECDRLNDRQQYSDAMLVLTGVVGIGADPADSAVAMQRLRQERTLALPDSDAKAEWLIKNPQEHDVEVLRRALIEDIHKFSLTPDFADERFAGNASGIAIKYKLFNFDNKMKLKERYFVTGLRERARAFCGWLKTRRGIDLDADLLTFRLTRRLPVNEAERAQSLKAMQDILPVETLAYHSPFVAP